jgi:hypothetical protein
LAANETETGESSKNTGVFADAYCDSLSYQLWPKGEEFKIDDFLLAVGGGKGNAPATGGSFICSSKSRSSGYHLHVSWHKRQKGDFAIRLVFYGSHRDPDPDEREPFAEDFFRWLSQFLVAEGPREVHVHADFDYPSSVRTVRFFPLPMKTAITPKNIEIEIDGISFNITEPINGVEKLWLTQLSKSLTVHLAAERKIDFKSFDAAQELAVLSETVEKILGGKSNDDTTAIH